MSAVTLMQLRWPGSAMQLGADLLHRCLAGPSPGDVDVGKAVAYGLELGRLCGPLLAQRWEEGWDRPLVHWQEQLGITALVAGSPFAWTSGWTGDGGNGNDAGSDRSRSG